MELKKYFNEAKEKANDFFYFDDYAADDFDFDGDEDFDFDGDEDEWDNAVGRGNAATSQPYILNVENTTTSDISNVTILGAASNIGGTAPAYGNATGISITMGISNVTYGEFLYTSLQKPFSIGLTYLSSTNDNQVLETMTLSQKDVNGNTSQKVLTPSMDPYQQQSGKIAMQYNYNVDGFTSIIISKILAKSGSVNGNVKIYFYPSENVSTGRALAGRKAVRGYARPRVVRDQKLSLTRGALRGLSSGRRRRR